jgi:cytochrome c-type biogenesis protein CcmE
MATSKNRLIVVGLVVLAIVLILPIVLVALAGSRP